MPNWKKLITSGSNAVLNDITASGEILIPQYVEHLNDTDTKLGFSASNTVVLVTGGSTRLKANNSGVEVTGLLDATKEKQIIHTNGEVLKAGITSAFVPFANINLMDADVQTGYFQYVAPVDGYVEKVIVSPHQAATSGTVGLTWKSQSGNLGSEVNGTISATAGVPTTYTFGSSYNFGGDDRLSLLVDRGASARSMGFGFTIILRLDFLS
jgi:hypothetical protein|tara:strand:- start:525 stop:1157 length:633 start_codon:yes stop_codon:yes gene_type:complete